MKKGILGLMMIFFSYGATLYAADGDLVVNGKLGVGVASPSYKLDVSGAINATKSAQDANAALSLTGNGWLTINPNSSAGSWNSLVQAGDKAVIFSNGSQNTGNLVIGPWGSGGSGIRITNSGLVGIGTATPLFKLDVLGSLRTTYLQISDSGVSTYATIQAPDNSQGWVRFYGTSLIKWGLGKDIDNSFVLYDWTNGKNTIRASSSGDMTLLQSSGKLGIGMMFPSYQLHLSTDSAGKLSTNTWTISSDARLKTDIQPYTKGLNEILQIKPITYKYNGKGGIGHNRVKKKDPETGTETETDVVDTELLSKTNIGVLAQDIQSVVPESIGSHKGKINDDDPDETDILDFNSHSLTFILINAVKELKAEIDSLNQQIADLKAKVK